MEVLMENKNMEYALLRLFESAFNDDLRRSESDIAKSYARFNNGEQLSCEMISTAVTEDADGKNMELSILIGRKEFIVNIRVCDVESVYEEDDRNE
jgi:hypothetical protein